jgi:hypothetical protein
MEAGAFSAPTNPICASIPLSQLSERLQQRNTACLSATQSSPLSVSQLVSWVRSSARKCISTSTCSIGTAKYRTDITCARGSILVMSIQETLVSLQMAQANQNTGLDHLASMQNQLASQSFGAAQQYAALQNANAGQVLEFNGGPENAKAVMGRGPCEVCSAPDSVLYFTRVRATDGSRTELQTCWDCWEVIPR